MFTTIVTPPAGSPKFKKGTRPDAGLCEAGLKE